MTRSTSTCREVSWIQTFLRLFPMSKCSSQWCSRQALSSRRPGKAKNLRSSILVSSTTFLKTVMRRKSSWRLRQCQTNSFSIWLSAFSTLRRVGPQKSTTIDGTLWTKRSSKKLTDSLQIRCPLSLYSSGCKIKATGQNFWPISWVMRKDSSRQKWRPSIRS